MSARLNPSRWLLGLLLAVLSGVACADFKKDYQDGVDAAKRGEWAEVRRLMGAALAEESTPSKRMRTYGTNFIPYVPHYYLGLANARLGDCAAAVSAFKTPASESVVAGLPLATEQRATLAKCEQQMLAANTVKPADPPPAVKPPVSTAAISSAPISTTPIVADTRPPVVSAAPVKPPVNPTSPALPNARVAPVTSALARIDALISGLDRQLRTPPIAGTGDAKGKSRDLEALRQQRQQAATDLSKAQSAGDAGLLARVEAQASKLESELGTLGQRIASASKGLALAQEARELGQLKTRASTALAKLDQTLAAASTAGIAATASSAATAARSGLQQAASASERAVIERALSAATSATTQLANAVAAAPKPAPEQLRALVGWYLAANYAQAAKWDGVAALPDPRARAQALLVRAAARWHLYVRGGEQDSILGASIDTDLRNAKRLDRALKPNAQAFSPKLVQRFAAL